MEYEYVEYYILKNKSLVGEMLSDRFRDGTLSWLSREEAMKNKLIQILNPTVIIFKSGGIKEIEITKIRYDKFEKIMFFYSEELDKWIRSSECAFNTEDRIYYFTYQYMKNKESVYLPKK